MHKNSLLPPLLRRNPNLQEIVLEAVELVIPVVTMDAYYDLGQDLGDGEVPFVALPRHAQQGGHVRRHGGNLLGQKNKVSVRRFLPKKVSGT